MNSAENPHIDPVEWDAQERALRATLSGERLVADTTTSDYLRVAQAIATAPLSGPPMDLAGEVAVRISGHDAWVERWVSRVLLGLLATVTVLIGAWYAPAGWQAWAHWAGPNALAWMLAGAGCIALSSIGARWRGTGTRGRIT